MQTIKTIGIYSIAALFGAALIYLQIRIIRECGLSAILFGGAEWRWIFGYC
jgi:hypothetical protein